MSSVWGTIPPFDLLCLFFKEKLESNYYWKVNRFKKEKTRNKLDTWDWCKSLVFYFHPLLNLGAEYPMLGQF